MGLLPLTMRALITGGRKQDAFPYALKVVFVKVEPVG
jgi:hypothetical protein